MPAGKSLVGWRPEDPYQPWAAAQSRKMRRTSLGQRRVLPERFARSIYTPGGFQLRQSAGYVVFLFDRAHNYRIVQTDGRPHLAGS
jgi:hypothetical protein